MYDKQFVSIYEKNKWRIYSYVLKKTRNQTVAEDITSETFLKLLKAIQEDRSIVSYALAWLYRVAGNLVIDHFRSSYYSKTSSESEEIEHRGASSEGEAQETEIFVAEYTEMLAQLEKDEQQKIVLTSMKDLKEEDQEIIELRLAQELPFKEIAVILEGTEPAMKMRYSRAIDKLKALCAQHYES
jgi:RNA polymerase sigma-70 factor (ECF subfamily)